MKLNAVPVRFTRSYTFVSHSSHIAHLLSDLSGAVGTVGRRKLQLVTNLQERDSSFSHRHLLYLCWLPIIRPLATATGGVETTGKCGRGIT